MRLFVAIKIEPDTAFLNLYRSLQTQLGLEKIKWVEPQNLHLTLKFIGKTPEDQLNLLHTNLQEVALRHSGFDLRLEKAGIFGSSYQPRVLWLGSNEQEELRALGEDVLNSLDAIGFQRDRQNFVPHLTVGRIKQLTDKKFFQTVMAQYRDAFFQEVKVNEFLLYESRLNKQEPVYRVLRTYNLSSQ